LYFLIIIPIACILFLYFVKEGRSSLWEYCVPCGVSFLIILAAQKIGEYTASLDTEFHGGIAQKCVWDEEWTETYLETVTETDSKGRTTTHVEVRTRHHPNEYHVEDSNSYTVSVDKNHYLWLKSLWKSEKIEKPWHSGQSSWGDGRRFITTWKGKPETFVPCFTSHKYVNRVGASRSIFNYSDVTPEIKKKYGLFEYPEIHNFHLQNSILGISDNEAEKILTEFNAKEGSLRQIRIFILIFQDQPLDAALYQQSLWKNGNKNEVVVCVGRNNSILWVFPFCWTNERLLVDLREDIASMKKFDAVKVTEKSIDLVRKEFKRKAFKDFEYIYVPPSTTTVVVTFILLVTFNVGFSIYILNK
jgi:hypothetical protein